TGLGPGRLRPRCLLEDPSVAMLLQVPGEVGIAALDDPAIDEHVDVFWNHVVEQALVVGHDEHRARRAAHRIDPVRDEAQRVDVEAGVRFVEDAELRLEDRHLEDLVFLLLAAGETLVQPALHEGLVEAEELRLVLHEAHEIHRVDLLEPAILAYRLQDFLAADLDLQVLDLEHPHSLPRPGRAQPTVPSRFRLTLISFWASTANSIGSFRKTCLQKPLTIMFVASSGVMPRVWQ